MPEYEVHLFGRTSIIKGGKFLEMDTRKAMALFSYLLVTGSGQNRDSLALLFWPDANQSSARGALRRTLSSLRKAVGEENLKTGRDIVSINPEADLLCDAVLFRRLLSEIRSHQHENEFICETCLMNYVKAADLYTGDFMAGFGLRDSLIFDNWQFTETEQFRRELAEALLVLVRSHTLKGKYMTALEYCRRWLSLDPLNETAHRELMVLYAYSGQREAAMRQYRECVRILETEIGVPPLDETTHLYEEIKLDKIKPPEPLQVDSAQGVDAETAALFSSPPAVDGTPDVPTHAAFLDNFAHGQVPRLPMIGREQEFEDLLTRYYGIKADGRFAVLTGETGIGKTRLGEEFMRYLKANGVSCLNTRCYEGEQELAYSLFSSLLRSGIESAAGSKWWEGLPPYSLVESARLVPELAELVPQALRIASVDGPGAQTRFFTGLRDVLFKLVTPGEMSGPGILFLDDLHWIDAASIELLTFMTRRLKGHPVFILCTWEDVRTESTSRLNSLVSSLQRDHIASLYSLKRLDSEQVDLLVSSAQDMLFVETKAKEEQPGLDALWLERLITDSEGNPFILTAYLHTLARDRLMPGETKSAPPDSVRDLLMARLGLVSSSARQILQTAAVTGRSFDFQTILEASGRGEEETITAMEELLSRGLVRETRSLHQPGIFYDFSHEIMRQMVCEDVSLARSRLLNRRIAESMERRLLDRTIQLIPQNYDLIRGPAEEILQLKQKSDQSTSQLAGQIARHYLLAGEVEKAAQFMYKAGEHEQSLYANKEAMVHFSNALALGYVDRFSVYMAMGELHVLEGQYTEAIRSYQAAASQDTAAEVSRECLIRVEWKIGQVYARMGEWQQALQQFKTAIENLDTGSNLLWMHISIDRSLALYQLGEIQDAQAMAAEILERAKLENDDLALAQAHNLLGVLLRARGKTQDAVVYLERSFSLAEALNEPSVKVAALNNLALVYQNSGDYATSESLVQQALSICLQQGDRHREAALRNHLADLFQVQGKKEDAMDQLLLAVAILSEIGESIGTWQPEIWKLVEW